MTFSAIVGNALTQSGTDTTSAGLASVVGITAPAGGRMYASADAVTLQVTGQYTAPVETLQFGRIGVTASGASFTVGADDGAPVSGGTIYLQNPTTGSTFGTGVLWGTSGATINLRNANVVVAPGTMEGGAEIGAFGSSWVLNAKNINFIKQGAWRGWHYIGGGGTLQNVTWRNCHAVFFLSSPASASGLSVTQSTWGFGIDGLGLTVNLSASQTTRMTIQRAGNTFNLTDFRITDYVSCREQPASNSFYKFFRRVGVQAVGEAKAAVPYYVFDKDGVQLITGTTDANGAAAAQSFQWGQVNTLRMGANTNSETLANKFTADNISNNTGIGHDPGMYKPPLTAVFAKYGVAWSAQSGIVFDVAVAEYMSPFALGPNLVADASITESNAVTVAAYTVLDTAAKARDYSAYWKRLPANVKAPTLLIELCTRTGETLDFGALNVTIDANAAQPLAYNAETTTATLKASVFKGSVTSTGTVTLLNGAVITGVVFDANNAGSINVTGLAPSDTAEMRRASDNTLIASRTGPGSFAIAPANVGVSVYFERKVGAVLVMSTQTTPVTLSTVNEDVPMFAGPQVAVANIDGVAKEETLLLRPTLAQMTAGGIALEASVQSRASQTSVDALASTNQTEHDATQAAIAAIPPVNLAPVLTAVDALPTLPEMLASTLAKQADLSGLATAANVIAAQTAIVGEINAKEVKIDAVKADTAAIKAKTDTLTAAPTVVQIRTELETAGSKLDTASKKSKAAWVNTL